MQTPFLKTFKRLPRDEVGTIESERLAQVIQRIAIDVLTDGRSAERAGYPGEEEDFGKPFTMGYLAALYDLGQQMPGGEALVLSWVRRLIMSDDARDETDGDFARRLRGEGKDERRDAR